MVSLELAKTKVEWEDLLRLKLWDSQLYLCSHSHSCTVNYHEAYTCRRYKWIYPILAECGRQGWRTLVGWCFEITEIFHADRASLRFYDVNGQPSAARH